MITNKPVQIHKFHNSAQQFIHFFNIEADLELAIIQTGHQLPVLVEHLIPIIRDHYLLHFVRNGSGSLFLPNATYQIDTDDCFLIYPQQIANYTSHNDEGWEYYWIGFSGSKAEKYLSLAGFSHERQVIRLQDPEASVRLEHLMQDIMTASFHHQNDFTGLELQVGSLLRSFFHTLYEVSLRKKIRIVPALPKDNTSVLGAIHQTDNYVSTIIMLIQSNYSQDIKVEDIAAGLHLNRSYLTTLFKKETGKSIKQYLIYYRILSAQKLLAETNLSVTDISIQVGFSDPLYFSRLFKEQVGLSPSQYRQSLH